MKFVGLGWSNSRSAWIERLSLIATIVGAVGLYFAHGRISQEAWVVLLFAWLGMLAFGLRQGWVRLFGPVLFYDLVRQTRRGRFFWLRFSYGALLALLLAWIYGIWWWQMTNQYGDGDIPIRQVAEFARMFFTVFIIVQFIVILVMTPAYTAGAIAEEKERKTLEFLLATDLRNREIIFGKLASRITTLTLFLLTGLPILSLLQFFGGVDPELLIAGFLGTVVTMLSVAAVSMFCSVVAKKARDAIGLTYIAIITYYLLSSVGLGVMTMDWATESVTILGHTISWADAFQVFGYGNTFVAFAQLVESQVLGGSSMYDTMLQYVGFHGAVVVLALAYSAWRMRAIALQQSYGAIGKSKREKRAPSRPDVGMEPMLWKEVFVESGMRMNWVGFILLLLIVLLSYLAPVIILYNFVVDHLIGIVNWYDQNSAWDQLAESMNAFVRGVGTAIACLLLLGVGVRASGAMSGERDRQTIDSLMTTPLSTGQVLWGKWWGCILGMRRGMIWLGSIYLLGLVTGGLSIFALPGLAIAYFIYASLFAWIGIWFSLVSRTTLQSTIITIVAMLLLGGGYMLVLSLACLMPLALLEFNGGDGIESLMKLFVGFCPPVVLSYFPFYSLEPSEYGMFGENEAFYIYAIIGLIGWVFASIWMAFVAQRRFRRQFNRIPTRPTDEPMRRRSPYDDNALPLTE